MSNKPDQLESKQEASKRMNSLVNGLSILMLVCIFVPFIIFVWIYDRAGGMPVDVANWGIYGDFVGGLSNPVISSVTFIALIATIIQNQKALRVNEEELAATRKEIEMTREAAQKQAAEHERQNQIIKNKTELELITQALLLQTEHVVTKWNSQYSHSNTLRDVHGYYVTDKFRDAPPEVFDLHYPRAMTEFQTLSLHVKIISKLASEYSEKSVNNAQLVSALSFIAEPVLDLLGSGLLKSMMNDAEIEKFLDLLGQHVFLEVDTADSAIRL